MTAGKSERFDLVVLGAGPAGETVASRLAGGGRAVALVERELIGGECAYWACIPSKTLLRPPEVRSEAERAAGLGAPEQRWEEVAKYRDFMIRNLDDQAQVDGYERDGVRVYKGEGVLDGPGRVDAAGQTLLTDRIVVATGSDALIPPIPGLQEAGYWTNREATTLKEIPASVLVLGGGPVGIELGQMLRRFGAKVDLIEASDRLLAREDERVSELLLEALREDGVEVHLGAEVSSVASSDGDRVARLESGKELRARELLVAVGRTPRVGGIGLETVGLEPNPKGIQVDERCRAAEGIWAIGDCTGAMPFTHVGMYQGRIACADVASDGASGRTVDLGAVPRVVFSDPELASVGLTQSQARERGIEPVTARVELGKVIARPWTYEQDPRGELMVIADPDSRTLLGAWAVGPMAGEWIHYAALAIKAKVGLDVLRDAVAQFPTYTEAYLKALEQLEL
jgi:dihydrolipoamide dehydrogenase